MPATDERARAGLEESGHVLDATPRAMGFELSACGPPTPIPSSRFARRWTWSCSAQINETAYGYPPGDFPAIAPMPGTEAYLGSIDGETVGSTLVWAPGEDAEITFVATLPEARGRGDGRAAPRPSHWSGSARREISHDADLNEARLSRLQGAGYRDVGGLEMWERRKAA